MKIHRNRNNCAVAHFHRRLKETNNLSYSTKYTIFGGDENT